MAAGVRRTTTKKHAGLPAKHGQRGRPLQTPDSGKGYGWAGKQSGLVAPLLRAKGLLLDSDLLFYYIPSDDPKVDF